MRVISSINLQLTNWCSMKCPDCCCSIPEVPREDRRYNSWEYFEHAATYFRGIERIHCTGGEPTLHPQFQEFAAKFRELFQCQLLTVETNGFGFTRFPEVFTHFDRIYASHYTPESFPGCQDNTDAIDYIKSYCAGRVRPEILVGKIVFTPKSRRGTQMCPRGTSETVAYANGLLFPCCVGPGLPVINGIPLAENWREEILKVHPPCSECWFAL